MTAESSESWAKVIVSGTVVTVKVEANSGEARAAVVTVRADKKIARVEVTQQGI